MAQIETWFDQDLKKPVSVRFIDGNIFSADNYGSVVGVRVYKNGVEETLTGTVSGLIIRPDGATVAVSGTIIQNNKAYISLPQSAVAYPGVISIVLKLTTGSIVTTLLAVVANVYQSSTDTAVDPGTIIPDISALIAAIDEAVSSIPADYSNLWTSVAPAFDSSKTYSNGQYVTYNGRVYRFFKSHSGAWNSNDVYNVDVGDELAGINSAFGSVASGVPITVTRTLSSGDGTVELRELKLFSGMKYRIYCNANYGVNFYAAGGTSNFVQLTAGMNYYTPTCDGFARIYNGNAQYSGTFTIVVWEGDMLLSGYPTTVNNTSALETLTGGSHSCNAFPPNSIVCIGSTDVPLEDGPNRATGTYITYSHTGTIRSGSAQIYIGSRGEIAYRVCWGAGYVWGAWHYSNGDAVYHVGTGQTYTSFTSLLYDLKDDKSNKTIYIHEGTYDIFAEYKALVSAGKVTDPPDSAASGDYGLYSVFVPDNTRVIGLGDVVLNMTPTASNVTLGESYMWSPLTVSGNVKLENLTVNGKNCRYCLHNDDHNAVTNAHQHYKNCRFIYNYGDTKNGERLGYSNTIGFGIGDGCTHTFEDCEIVMLGGGKSAYYGHERSDGKNGTLILRNCIIRTDSWTNSQVIRLQTLATTAGHVKAYFDNCYINGGITLDLNNSASRNNFEVTLSNCNKTNVSRVRSDSSVPVVDPFTVRWYNPLGTPTSQNPLVVTDSI